MDHRLGNSTRTLKSQSPDENVPGCYLACLQRRPTDKEYTFCSAFNHFVLIGRGSTFARCGAPRRLVPGWNDELYFAAGVAGELDFPDCEACVPMNTNGTGGVLFLVLTKRPEGTLRVKYANLLRASAGPVYFKDMQRTVSGAVLSGSMAGGAHHCLIAPFT